MIQNSTKISGFILAGGKSRRMGRDKGSILFRGTKMIQHAIEPLRSICDSITIISNHSEYEDLGYPVYPDFIKNRGPLAGICTALEISENETNIFLTCDSPFITEGFLQLLINASVDFDAVVPSFQDKIYPLTAVYKKSCLSIFESRLKQNKLRVKEVIPLIKSKTIKFTENQTHFNQQIFTNINTPEDLKENEC